MRRLEIVPFLVLVLLLSTALPQTSAGAGGGGGGGLCAGFAEGSTVTLRDSCFDGTAHFAEEGVELTVRNAGGLEHNLTAVDGSFATATLAPEASETLAVEPGVHEVYCTLHSGPDGGGMAGVLLIGEQDAVLATAATAEPAGSGGVPGWAGGFAFGAALLGGLWLAAAIANRRERLVG